MNLGVVVNIGARLMSEFSIVSETASAQNTKRNLPLQELCFRGVPPSSRLTKVTLIGDHAENTSCKLGAASIMPDIEVRECESDVLPNKPRHPMVPQLVGI